VEDCRRMLASQKVLDKSQSVDLHIGRGLAIAIKNLIKSFFFKIPKSYLNVAFFSLILHCFSDPFMEIDINNELRIQLTL